jgi:hypothetical protein
MSVQPGDDSAITHADTHASLRIRPSAGLIGLAAAGVALAAVAVGALAIGRLSIGRARIRRLEIDELAVRRLRVTESLDVSPTVTPIPEPLR